MTLSELAQKLYKVFRFKWLTVNDSGFIQAWWGIGSGKPNYYKEDGRWYGSWIKTNIIFEAKWRLIGVDLSEYEDENGKVDYSKCIVEVADDF